MASQNADHALQKLLDGNRRYVTSNASHPNQSGVHRITVAREPKPFAAILGCADSRVPPELIFDQGLGDLFVIRVAGNVIDDFVLGSIEYAVERFDLPLLLVLGHQECAAVAVTIQREAVTSHITKLVAAIQPAVEKAQRESGDLLDHAIKANVQLVVNQLRSAEPILAKRSRTGRLKIVGAHYELYTGLVTLIA